MPGVQKNLALFFQVQLHQPLRFILYSFPNHSSSVFWYSPRVPHHKDGASLFTTVVIWALPLGNNASATAAVSAKSPMYVFTVDVRRSRSTTSFWRLSFLFKQSFTSAQNKKNSGAAISKMNNSLTNLMPFTAKPESKEQKNSECCKNNAKSSLSNSTMWTRANCSGTQVHTR